MHGVIAKLAKLAVSKAAAFTYAVAVGVAANLAFNFVQQHHPPPAPTAAAPADQHPIDRPADHRPAAIVGPEATALVPPHRALRPGQPVPAAPPEKPPAPARHPAAASPVLPELPAARDLPDAASLPAPALKAAILPTEPEAPRQASTPPGAAVADIPKPAPERVVLAPLGKPVEVAAPPLPPPAAEPQNPSDAEALTMPAAGTSRSAGAPPPADSLPPARTVADRLHRTAGLPAIGNDAPLHRPAAAAPPIPLIPSGADSAKPDQAGAAPTASAHPGPGSGGLY